VTTSSRYWTADTGMVISSAPIPTSTTLPPRRTEANPVRTAVGDECTNFVSRTLPWCHEPEANIGYDYRGQIT
jgi:hypothetical protein